MLIDAESYVFLEHHGVKGMRWGQRKAGSSGGKASNTKSKRKMSPNQKQALKVLGTAGIMVGAAVGTKLLLNKYGAKPVKSVSRPINPNLYGRGTSKMPDLGTLLGRLGPKKVSTVPKVNTVIPDLGKSQHARNLRRLASAHLKTVQQANQDLKDHYTRENIPLPKREYLKTDFWEKQMWT